VNPDVVVIGAGALGLSTALHCALLGRAVVVVERDTAGSQASGRAAGLFKSVQADELRTTLARRSIARAVSFADWAAVPLEVSRSGSFLVARTGEHRAYLRVAAGRSRGWGADVVPGLWVASGCNGSGFSSSLAIGEALAGWICDMPGRLDIGALSPARLGSLTDEALITAGLWQYAHYYDPM
jgi:glycine/D-amino acid oxidase-like deaminating enzyme